MPGTSAQLANLYEAYRLRRTLSVLDLAKEFLAPLLVDLPAEWKAAQSRIAYGGDVSSARFGSAVAMATSGRVILDRE